LTADIFWCFAPKFKRRVDWRQVETVSLQAAVNALYYRIAGGLLALWERWPRYRT
jgi:hypothetical protein